MKRLQVGGNHEIRHINLFGCWVGETIKGTVPTTAISSEGNSKFSVNEFKMME